MKNDQLVIERSADARSSGHTDSTVKTIVLHVQNDQSLSARVETGLALARASSAHLSCVHVTPFEAYVAFDNFGGVFVMNDVIKALDEEETDLRSRVEEELRNEDVSWDYTQVTGSIARVIAGHAALADFVVTGRNGHARQFAEPAIGMLGDLLHWSRTPLLIPADEDRPFDPTGTALIAWDGSFQSANAVRSSLGLLKLASSVHVLHILEEEKEEAFPSTRMLEYLSRHGIHAELSVIEAGVDVRDQAVISATLMARAKAIDAAYMVMGGYNHSRIGEYIFGGVTRSMLKGAPLPLVIAR